MSAFDPGVRDSGAVVLWLRVEPGEPPTGTAMVEGEGNETRFSGWVELMAAITAARATARPTTIEGDG